MLTFLHNRVKRERSKKKLAPVFNGKAMCKFRGYTRYTFLIKKTPKPNRNVKVKVKMFGNIRHDTRVLKLRHVAGKQRRKMAEAARLNGNAETFYDNLGKAKEESLKAGNFNNVPSELAIRQMLHEVINAELIDKDIYRELDIVCDMVVDFIPGGYIKYLTKNPFSVILFSDLQVKLLNQVIKSKENRLYLDATGSVINKVPDQPSKVLYDALVVSGINANDPLIPVARFISNRHTVPDILIKELHSK